MKPLINKLYYNHTCCDCNHICGTTGYGLRTLLPSSGIPLRLVELNGDATG